MINVYDFEWHDDAEDHPKFKLTRFNNVSLNHPLPTSSKA